MHYTKVPLDGSPLSEFAIPAALELATKFDSEITLLRVITSTMLFDSVPEVTNIELMMAVRNESRERVETYLRGLKGSLRQQGYVVHAQMVIDQTPADAILDVSEALGNDVIVMSTHGRGGLSRWVYGSVADKVLRKCHIPVLLVRPDNEVLEEAADTPELALEREVSLI